MTKLTELDCIDFQLRIYREVDHGRFAVLDDGSLLIERLQNDDAGDYVCEIQSETGVSFAKARLDVKGILFN